MSRLPPDPPMAPEWCSVRACACGHVHVHVGAISLTLAPDAFRILAAVLARAAFDASGKDGDRGAAEGWRVPRDWDAHSH